jgi:hypothetical protein
LWLRRCAHDYPTRFPIVNFVKDWAILVNGQLTISIS